jgi:cellulose synthase/poly-beta-1,6-N-acetylglucosamine synthase-like glycosyltransferase
MVEFAYVLIAGAAFLVFYTYAGYPMLLLLLSRIRNKRLLPVGALAEWPRISITVPVYNEATQIRALIERLLELDYPADRREILIVSDASTDGTDAIVEEFKPRGVKLLRMPERSGKTAAENAARHVLTGEIVVNTDASIKIDRDALKPLISQFADPAVGLASGRDVSVSAQTADANAGESGYVGYEMWIRGLETRVESIVGASGCFYAIRVNLHRQTLPDYLSRDFASALITRENKYRAVSVDAALCYVPRTNSLEREYKRKVRTITRGIETLWHKRAVLNPFTHPLFGWMLFSHKICRWLVPWAVVAGALGLALLAPSQPFAAIALAAGLLPCVLGGIGWALASSRPLPRWLSLPASVVVGNAAAVHAALRALHGEQNPIWEPTRRDAVPAQ